MAQFIQKAVASMKRRGTLGSFGKASPDKIKRAMKKGGRIKRKAVFARSMKRISEKRSGK